MEKFEFVVGSIVRGNSFIGRKRILNNVVNKLGTFSFAINGMNKIGKTSLIKYAIEKKESEENSNLIMLYKDLNNFKSIHHFMYDVFHDITKKIIEERKTEIGKLVEIDKIVLKEFFEFFSKRNFDKNYLFGNSEADFLLIFKKINVKIVLVIDEFDKALEIFESEDFNAIRSYVHDPEKYSLNIVLVSRMLINEIELKTSAYSKLSGILSEFIDLVGFDSDDLIEYYSILEGITGSKVQNYYKELLEHYTGNHPFMLSIFGHEISENGLIPPFQIFESRVQQITSFYKSLIQNMSSDEKINNTLPIDVRRDEFDIRTKLLKFHVGPRINLKKIDIEILKNRGFLYQKNKDGNIKYETVSEDFLEYFEDLHQVHLADIWPQLMDFQKLLRELINREFGQNDNSICDKHLYNFAIEENKLVDHHNSSNVNKDKWYYIIDKKILDGFTIRKRSILKSMNFLELYNVIKHSKHFASRFKKYFKTDEIIKNGKADFKLLRDARNSMAHDDRELTKSEIEKINELCLKYKKEIIIN